MSMNVVIALALVPVTFLLIRRFIAQPIERALVRRFGRTRFIEALLKKRGGGY